MNTDQDKMQDRDRRIENRAWHLWEADGSPKNQLDRYRQEARLLEALEEDPDFAKEQVETSRDETQNAEPVEAIENQGEFPSLRDQGDGSPLPRWPSRRESWFER